MTEAELQHQIMVAAADHGWLRIHILPAQMSDGTWRSNFSGDAGSPDLILVHDKHGVLFIELKGKHGKPTTAQIVWLGTLHNLTTRHPQGPVGVFLWRPQDWDDGTIGAILASGFNSVGGRRTNL